MFDQRTGLLDRLSQIETNPLHVLGVVTGKSQKRPNNSGNPLHIVLDQVQAGGYFLLTLVLC